jgi:hypothetical protein
MKVMKVYSFRLYTSLTAEIVSKLDATENFLDNLI